MVEKLSFLNSPKFFKTNHHLSNDVAKLISIDTGIEVKNIKEYDDNSDKDAILYGILRGCFELMEKLRKNNKNYINIDHGYFGKNFYRFTKNARGYEYKLLDLPMDRFNSLDLEIQDYKSGGADIIVLPPSPYWGFYYNINVLQWNKEVTNKLKKFTDKNIIIKSKTDSEKPLKEYLKNAHALVHYSSMGAVEALLMGVPVITLGPSFLKNYTSSSIEEIENPRLIEREKLFANLSFNQFSYDEIRNGFVWHQLNEIYKAVENG